MIIIIHTRLRASKKKESLYMFIHVLNISLSMIDMVTDDVYILELDIRSYKYEYDIIIEEKPILVDIIKDTIEMIIPYFQPASTYG